MADVPFVRPAKIALHFSAFFSDTSVKEAEESLGIRGSVLPLRLESLRLKNFGLESDAFLNYFDVHTINTLQLPHSRVYPGFWDSLTYNGTQLQELSGIDSDLVTPQLLHFLGSQLQIHTLTFAEPLLEFMPAELIWDNGKSSVIYEAVTNERKTATSTVVKELRFSIKFMPSFQRLVLPMESQYNEDEELASEDIIGGLVNIGEAILDNA